MIMYDVALMSIANFGQSTRFCGFVAWHKAIVGHELRMDNMSVQGVLALCPLFSAIHKNMPQPIGSHLIGTLLESAN